MKKTTEREERMKQQGSPDSKKGFRNHISIVAEQMGSFFYILLIMAVSALAQNVDRLKDASFDFLKEGGVIIGALVCLLVLAFIIGRNLFVWAKTRISIQENAIVIERNTVNRKKHTIGIKNISNINTEQNLFEMLLGTCKVKLDTNSLSTADKTDVKILLKKREAEAFCGQLARIMKAYEEGRTLRNSEPDGVGVMASGGGPSAVNDKADTGRSAWEGDWSEESYDVRADFGALFVHGLFSINIFSLCIVIAGGVGAAATIIGIVRNPGSAETVLGMLISIFIAASIFFSALWDIVKGFVHYYDFRAKREKDKIYIRYGFLKKVAYTIPVDKIQALKIRQTFLARLAGKYMVEVINVGMNDEANQKAFLVLYGSYGQMEGHLQLLLPEFADSAAARIERTPAAVWAVWMLPLCLWTGVIGAAALICCMVLERHILWIWLGAGVLILCILLGMVLWYRTAGIGLNVGFLKITRGYFGRQSVILKYGKIQYLKTSQNFIARACGIEKGKISLLASMGEQSQGLPYFRMRHTEWIKEKIVANRA